MARSTTLNIGFIGGAQLLAALANQIVIIILAHFLDPSDFGVFAVCQVAMNLALSISGFGLEEAAIQTKKSPEESIITAANLRIILACTAGATLFVAAPAITDYFAIDEATSALRVLSISFVILGLAFVPRTWLRRELRFGKLAVSTVVNTLMWSASALILGASGAGYWALIAAFLIGISGSCVALWLMRPSKVRLQIDKGAAKDLLRYGSYLMATSVVVFLLLNLDKVVIGKLLGSDELGVYWLAFLYGTQPALFLTGMMTYVVFPEYANLSQDYSRLREKHRRIIRYLALVSVPLGVGMASISPSFVNTLLGSEWTDAVVPLSILSIFGTIYVITSTSGIIFMSTDNTRQMFKQNIVMFIPFAVLLVPTVDRYGTTGVAVLFVLIILIQFLWVTRSIGRILSYSPLSDLKNAYSIPILASLAMCLVLLLVWLILGTSIVTLIAQLLLGVGVYSLIVIAATKGEVVQEGRAILHTIRSRGRA